MFAAHIHPEQQIVRYLITVILVIETHRQHELVNCI